MRRDTIRKRLFFAAALLLAGALPVQAGEISGELLLSSAWCTFSYNKVSGYSSSTRVRFNRNGTYSTGKRDEGYSSGRSGSMASQHDSGGAGRWEVSNGILFLSEGQQGTLQPVRTVLNRNSNGYAVIIADGVEYSQCN